MSRSMHGGRARLPPSRLNRAENAAQQELRPPKALISLGALSFCAARSRTRTRAIGNRGAILIELIVAAALLAVVVGGMASVQFGDVRALRAHYFRAVAMEIVDGEMEALLAGEWRAFGEGTQAYPVRADAARNLPDGRFTLTVQGRAVRLEWTPVQLRLGGRVLREATIP